MDEGGQGRDSQLGIFEGEVLNEGKNIYKVKIYRRMSECKINRGCDAREEDWEEQGEGKGQKKKEGEESGEVAVRRGRRKVSTMERTFSEPHLLNNVDK